MEEIKEDAERESNDFMALKFNQPDLNLVVKNCFRPAVERTGVRASSVYRSAACRLD
jgi:hypothetical protein